jgi:hypothetical protein
MINSKICIFANFFIDNEERLQRMKDSFESFKDIDAFEWRINVRGSLKEKAGDFLLSSLGTQLYLNYLNSKKGWFHDSLQIFNGSQSDYVLFWVEDHICLVPPGIIKEIISEMKDLWADQCRYSFLHNQHTKTFQVVPPDNVGNLIDVWNLNRKSASIIQRTLGKDFYVTSMDTIMRRDIFLKILHSTKPFLSRWPIHFPFDFEKQYNDGAIKNIRIALPKLEIFACIDDDHGVDGYSLISRGVYPNRISRIELKRLEFPRFSIYSNYFTNSAKSTTRSGFRIFLGQIYTYLKRIKYTFGKFSNFFF